MKCLAIPFTCFLLLAGCATSHDGMNATLWIQTSAEYQANSELVFNVAESRLPLLRDRLDVTADIDQAESFGCEVGEPCTKLREARLAPAVILDIDETVLDNSYYQARLVKFGGQWQPDTWDSWVAERAAIPVPGALAFIRRAKAEGVSLVYITNRRCLLREGSEERCPQKQDTIDNMASAGFPPLDEDDLLMLRGERPEWDESEKQSRRQYVAENYRILMLIGDDLGDFASNIKASSIPERAQFVFSHQSLQGEYWFQLTNPTYGSWVRALDDRPKREQLRVN